MVEEMFRSVTEDGLTLYGKLYLPKERPNKTVIHVHGWGDTYHAWQDGSPIHFITALAEVAGNKEYAFLSVDNRGCGLNSKYEIFEDCVLDIKSYIDKLEEMGCSSIVLEGHSTGANKVTHYEASTEDKRVKGLSLLSPTDDVGLLRYKTGEENFKKNLARARELILMRKGTEIMQGVYFWEDMSAQSFYNILNSSSCYAIFNYSTRDFRILSGIQIPKLVVFGSGDRFQINPTPKEALEMLAELQNMKTVLIEDANHRLDDKNAELAGIFEKWLKELNL